MSANPVTSSQSLQKTNRRRRPRLRFQELAYADFGLGNGGIFTDVSEGGVGFQAVAAIKDGQHIQLTFKLPGTTVHIDGIGQVAWLNDSGKGGGFHVVVWAEQGREQIRAWISGRVPTKTSAEQERETHLSSPQSAKGNARVIVATRGAGVSGVQAADCLLEAKDKERLLVSSPATTTASSVNTHVLPAPHARNRTLSSNVGATAKILLQFIASLARKAGQGLTKLFAPRWQFTFALGAVLGCLLTLAASVGVRLFSGTGAVVKVASPVPSAASQISQRDPSDPPAFQASHVAQREGRRADRRGTSVGRTASIPEAQGLPKPQPKPDVRRTMDFRAAVLLERIDPIYPPIAKEQLLGEAVEVNAIVAKDGVPHVLKFVSGEPRLAEAAMAAISLWRCKPALLNGQPVESQIDITVDFRSQP